MVASSAALEMTILPTVAARESFGYRVNPSRRSTIWQRQWSISRRISWMRGVSSEGARRHSSASAASLPPLRPVSAMLTVPIPRPR